MSHFVIPADPRLEAINSSLKQLKLALVLTLEPYEERALLSQIGQLQRTAEGIRRELLGVSR